MGEQIERCDECGFEWHTVEAAEVGGRISGGAAAIVAILAGLNEVEVASRPVEASWSPAEYAAHVRDVLLMMRDRVVLGVVEDTPSFAPMYREHRVDLGLYDDETSASLSAGLTAAADLYVRFHNRLDTSQLARPVIYNYPAPTERTVLWLSQQAVHEVEHHRDDIAALAAAIRPT